MYTFKIGIQHVDWEGLYFLYEDVNMLGRFIKNKDYEKIKQGFKNSYKVVTAWYNDKLIGACRMISDGICYGMVFDVAVLEDYQGRGIGKNLMIKLLEGEENMPVHLTATFGKEEFYKKLGFKKHKTAYSKYPFKTDYVEE